MRPKGYLLDRSPGIEVNPVIAAVGIGLQVSLIRIAELRRPLSVSIQGEVVVSAVVWIVIRCLVGALALGLAWKILRFIA
jgi:hypothetical protein